MADFGLVTIPTHYTIPPVDLARWAEENGFESVFFGEHTHIPTSRKTPFPIGGELPQCYKEFFDPFIALTAAAAVTQKLKVGTSVCLVPEHHPITLAKTISCLDRVSNGRFLFGIGAGLVIALLLSRLMDGLLYELSPRDPGVFVGVSVVLFVVAVAASLVPALRATRVDPMLALR